MPLFLLTSFSRTILRSMVRERNFPHDLRRGLGTVSNFPHWYITCSTLTRDGADIPHTNMKRRREERGFPEIKVSRRPKKATSGVLVIVNQNQGIFLWKPSRTIVVF
ncbi:hypothetical protein QL285_001827 [Trifolium repens]|nr:hypothetical protein QL285_001827 [Trifolium repens]